MSPVASPAGAPSRGRAVARTWHALEARDVLARLAVDGEGLSTSEARSRLETHGENVLLAAPPAPAWRILVDQVRSLIVALLFAAGLVSLALGDVLEAATIGAVLVIDVAIGFATEWRARRTMEALRSLGGQRARVLRDGAPATVDGRELVPGDVVLLEPGEAVSADLRLLSAVELASNEAPLTGESLPVPKSASPVAAEASLPERSCLVHKGTLVVRGTGRGVVVATGRATEVGRVAELVRETVDDPTPLERRLARLGRKLVWVTLLVAVVVIGLGLARGGEPWLMVETGIALAVAAVPEGLPVVAVVTLAIGMHRMARRRALVRRLAAVEALGSTTVICADKTGTLTAGEMTPVVFRTPRRELAVTGVGYGFEGELRDAEGAAVRVGDDPGLVAGLRVAALANRSEIEIGEDGRPAVVGDPTEGALLVLAEKGGVVRARELGRAPEVGEVPFTSERMLMATFHRGPEGAVEACVKGAPQRLIERSTSWLEGTSVLPLGPDERARVEAWNEELAGRGLRVLALGHRALAPSEQPGEEALRDLVFLGLVGLLDPPAPGVHETIRRLRTAGVRTVMITGDQASTARAVARELGVLTEDEEVLDARGFDALSDEELARRIEHVAAFSRMAPEQKLRIVRAFQARGESVGMLGDGVNDAAALKGADVGVAMGRRGTDVAKETADVVLQDDRFETVAAAVEGGRVIYDNIRKFVFYLFSGNLAEVLVLLLAGVFGWPLPLRPLQILWINLVSDVFPALALAVEPAEPDVMRRPPVDPAKPLFSWGFLLSCAGHAAVITAAVLWVYRSALGSVGEREAATLAFLVLGLAQILHVFNARSARPVLLSRRAWRNGWVWTAVLVSTLLMLATVTVPALAHVMGNSPPPGSAWLVVVAAAAVPLLLGQVWRALRPRPEVR